MVKNHRRFKTQKFKYVNYSSLEKARRGETIEAKSSLLNTIGQSDFSTIEYYFILLIHCNQRLWLKGI